MARVPLGNLVTRVDRALAQMEQTSVASQELLASAIGRAPSALATRLRRAAEAQRAELRRLRDALERLRPSPPPSSSSLSLDPSLLLSSSSSSSSASLANLVSLGNQGNVAKSLETKGGKEGHYERVCALNEQLVGGFGRAMRLVVEMVFRHGYDTTTGWSCAFPIQVPALRDVKDKNNKRGESGPNATRVLLALSLSLLTAMAHWLYATRRVGVPTGSAEPGGSGSAAGAAGGGGGGGTLALPTLAQLRQVMKSYHGRVPATRELLDAALRVVPIQRPKHLERGGAQRELAEDLVLLDPVQLRDTRHYIEQTLGAEPLLPAEFAELPRAPPTTAAGGVVAAWSKVKFADARHRGAWAGQRLRPQRSNNAAAQRVARVLTTPFDEQPDPDALGKLLEAPPGEPLWPWRHVGWAWILSEAPTQDEARELAASDPSLYAGSDAEQPPSKSAPARSRAPPQKKTKKKKPSKKQRPRSPSPSSSSSSSSSPSSSSSSASPAPRARLTGKKRALPTAVSDSEATDTDSAAESGSPRKKRRPAAASQPTSPAG